MHMPTLPPEGVARCAACGNEANDARCETCQCILQQCTQCFEMVPLLTDVGPSANTVLKEGGDEYELDEEKVAAAKAAKAAAEEETEEEDGGERKGKLAPQDLPIHSCRFHPGVFCESRATRFAVRQRREAVVCRSISAVAFVWRPRPSCQSTRINASISKCLAPTDARQSARKR